MDSIAITFEDRSFFLKNPLSSSNRGYSIEIPSDNRRTLQLRCTRRQETLCIRKIRVEESISQTRLPEAFNARHFGKLKTSVIKEKKKRKRKEEEIEFRKTRNGNII